MNVSLIQNILDETVKGQTRGLDYAAYAIISDDGKQSNIAPAFERVIESYNNKQLECLLKRFGCGTRTAEAHVKLWYELLPQVHTVIRSLDDRFIETGQGENVRVVFDIDMGGFYYTRLSGRAFLFGATLDQEEVNNGRCEREMHRMVAQIEAVFTVHGA